MARPTHSVISKFLAFTVMLLCSLFITPKANALEVDTPCAKAEIIFARGSGRPLTGNENKESSKFKEQLTSRLGPGLSSHYYELGTEWYGGHQYPAVKIDDALYKTGVSAWLQGAVGIGDATNYNNSIREGVLELANYINQRYEKCKTFGSYYILSGYSQGAQVIGQLYQDISAKIKNRIVYTSFFGDPKLFLPEGLGGDKSLACSKGKSVFSSYRMGTIDCKLWEGRLHARLNYLPTDLIQKTGLWCNTNDFICGTSNNPYSNGHDAYPSNGGAIYTAARISAEKLRATLVKDASSGSSQSPDPALIDTTHHYGERLTGQTTGFLVDMSEANRSNLPSIISYLDKTLHSMEAKGQRFSVAYYGDPLNNGTYFTSVNVFPGGYASADMQITMLRSFANWFATFPGGWAFPQGSLLDGIGLTLPHYNWQPGANKSLVVFTNATNPTGISSNLTQVVKQTLRIDPVNIYPVVPQDNAAGYHDLADQTAGQVLTYDKTSADGFEQASDQALAAIEAKPVALLGNTAYIAKSGQEVSFDASDSYALDGAITKYEWDFDGNGTFEQTTASPTASHSYPSAFDGIMQVRVTDSHGSRGNASATVQIDTYVAPVLPQAPHNLQATVIDTQDGKDMVRLTWEHSNDSSVTALALSINGIPLGLMTVDQTSIDVTDVERTDDVEFGVTGVNNDSEFGEAATVILAKPQRTIADNDLPVAAITSPTPRAILASARIPFSLGMQDDKSPMTFGSIVASPMMEYPSSDNRELASSNTSQIWPLLAIGTVIVVIGSSLGIIRFGRRH